jgi:hypothetical protein
LAIWSATHDFDRPTWSAIGVCRDFCVSSIGWFVS